MERCGGVAERDLGLALSLLVHGLGTGHAVCWNGSGTDCPEDGTQLPALQGLHTAANICGCGLHRCVSISKNNIN